MNKFLPTLIWTLPVMVSILISTQAQGEESNVDIHGFVSQGYIQTTKENQYPVGNSGGKGSYNFGDYGINFIKQVNPDLRVGVQLFAQDRGTYGNNVVAIDWAYGDYHYRDWLGFRAGKVKIPLGIYNTSRDNDALRNPILLPQGIYSDYYRDLTNSIEGIGFYGYTGLGSAGKLSYEFNMGTLPINNDSSISKAMGSTAAGSGPTYNYGLVWSTPVEGLRFAASGLWSKYTGHSAWIPTTPATDWAMDPWIVQVFSAEYVHNNLTLAFEYSTMDFDLNPDTTQSFVQKWRGDSWYVSGAYRFTDWMEIGTYYNEYFADRHHRDGSSYADYFYPDAYDMYQKDLALTVRFDPMRNVVVKFEAHRVEGVGLNWLQSPYGQVKDWHIFAAKVTYNF